MFLTWSPKHYCLNAPIKKKQADEVWKWKYDFNAWSDTVIRIRISHFTQITTGHGLHNGHKLSFIYVHPAKNPKQVLSC